MQIRLMTAWARVRDSLWFLPSVLCVLAGLLALAALWIDHLLLADRRATFLLAFQGGVDGARGVLEAIASTTITVTGLVFSITIVALQLASSQYSPRVMRGFIGDRVNQMVLGVFIGTFTYSLLVLRSVRSATDDGAAFVPSIAVGIAILLALVSIGFLIYYIHHAARSMQVSVIIDRATADTIQLVRRLFPEPIGEAAPAPPEPQVPTTPAAVVTADRAGYLQAVDAAALFALAQGTRLTVRMEPRMGAFVLPGAPLATVWPAEAVDDAVAGKVRGAFITGPERTLQADVELGIRQLSDIAIRALSPGVNDPTTAVNCIDRLGEILVVLGNRTPPAAVRSDGQDRVCFIASETTFDRAVHLSFDQVRHYGRQDPTVVAHLLEMLGQMAGLVPEQCRGVLVEQARVVVGAAYAATDEPADRAALDRVAARVFAALATEGPRAGDVAAGSKDGADVCSPDVARDR
jgi:uncharacterized membrane protein